MGKKIGTKIRKRILVPLVIALFLLLIFSALNVYLRELSHFRIIITENMDSVKKLLENQLQHDAELLGGLIDFLEEEENLRHAWSVKDRDTLYNQTLPLFNNMRDKYKVTHFYFIDLNGTVFLRVHNPTRYGDVIDRFTLRRTMITRSSTYGMELGPLGTLTLRRVYPWYFNGKLEGYIELGEEIQHITPVLKKILDVELIFLVDKSLLRRAGWEEGLRMMDRKGNWDCFREFAAIDSTLDSDKTQALDAYLYRDHEKHRETIFKIKFGNLVFRGGFVPLVDAAGRDLGDVIILKDFSRYEASFLYLFVMLVLVCAVIGGILFGFFYLFLGRIEASLIKAQNDIQKALEVKSNFISTVSHELRTPLTAIKEGIGIVLDGSAGDINTEQKDFLGTAKRNVDRLHRLINEVLDFQKLESGKTTLNIQENDINEAVMEIQRAMEPLAKEKGLNLTIAPADNTPKIHFDRDKIIQVLTNLVNNAIKFTETGDITISTISAANTVRIAVRDTGPGIAQKDMERLFQSFEQLGKERKTGGTGLGLAISKEIIEKHKGKIWAESELGKGTTFYFILPVSERRS